MNRNAILSALAIATAVFSASVVGYFVVSSDAHYDASGNIETLFERFDTLEERWLDAEKRIGELESRLARARSPRALDDDDLPVEEPLDAEPDESDEQDESDESSAERKLAMRVDDLERRIRGLEEDPIERGYSYIESENADLRREGILALERVAAHDEEARATIRAMLKDPDGKVRWTAVDTLADIDDKAAVPYLMEMLNDPEAGIRSEVVNSLSRLGAREAGPAIAGLLGDENDRVRERTVDALGDLKSAESGALLVGALKDKNERVRREAISALAEVGFKDALPELRSLYEDSSSGGGGGDRVRIAQTMRRLGDDGAWQIEFARLSQTALAAQEESARRDAIRTLAWVARNESKAVFQRALEDPSQRVRSEAQRALGNRRRR